MAVQTPAYSRLFSCLYDEQNPIGQIGRGTHYSVFRSAEWHDVMRRPLPAAQVHDFAVIWDEDHDIRVIEVVEKLYMKSLLSPVQFIGERKGGLSVILAAKFYWGLKDGELDAYKAAVVHEASHVWGDYWNVEFGFFDRAEIHHQTDVVSIIQDTDYKAEMYLRNIDLLWGLGTREFVPPVHQEVTLPQPIPQAPPLFR